MDSGNVARLALEIWAEQTQRLLLSFAQENPAFFTQGSMAYLQEKATSRQRTELRRAFRDADPAKFEAALQQLIADVGFEEAVKVLGGGRHGTV